MANNYTNGTVSTPPPPTTIVTKKRKRRQHINNHTLLQTSSITTLYSSTLQLPRSEVDVITPSGACEASDPTSGKVLEIFRNCSQAARLTRTLQKDIEKACEKGGGMVGDFMFRFVDLPGKSNNNKSTTSGGGDGTSAAFPAAISGGSAGVNGGNKNAQSARVINIDEDEEPADDDNSNTVAIVKHVPLEETFITAPDTHFDILNLKPLESIAAPKKKFVQLYCKGMQDYIVCFRGNMNAANALGLTRDTVSKMCDRTSEGDFVENCPTFPTFFLSYISNRLSPKVYQYGVHTMDGPAGSQIEETYGERIRRWRDTFKKENGIKVESSSTVATKMTTVKTKATPTKTAAATLATTPTKTPPTRTPSAPATLATTPPSSGGANPPTKEVLVSTLNSSITSGNAPSSINPQTPVTVTGKNQLLSQQNQGLCVICQAVRADVLFEPCQHTAICSKCYSAGACHKFCPICRTSIKSTSRPMFIQLVRPRIYSAHYFMS